ncbi:hypothetical protein [Paraburkholderia tropica]|uniref:hypothetical protein n=1 Tax=Paraburkholderia tropica TaxID=92647 RepID=UPI002AB71641|nr:hypothetical protein [Paraburkholderia tropica]
MALVVRPDGIAFGGAHDEAELRTIIDTRAKMLDGNSYVTHANDDMQAGFLHCLP